MISRCMNSTIPVPKHFQTKNVMAYVRFIPFRSTQSTGLILGHLKITFKNNLEIRPTCRCFTLESLVMHLVLDANPAQRA